MELTPANSNTAVSLPICRMYCNEDLGMLWPKPTGETKVSNDVIKINIGRISFETNNFKKEPAYWTLASTRFQDMQKKKLPKKFSLKEGGEALVVEVVVDSDDMGEFGAPKGFSF